MWWVLLLSVLLPVTALLGVAALSTLGLEADQVQLKKSYRWLYRWFLPLLRMDTVPNFVQLIKLVQAEAGMGNARVRPPRLELAGTELDKNLKIIREALRTRPQPVSGYTLSGPK